MARRTLDVTIDTEGRDKGKVFRITEMSASQAEAWAFRAFLALSEAGIDIPDDVVAQGVAGVAGVGFSALGRLSWEKARPLLDEMMSCLESVQPAGVRRLIESDIEEIPTRLFLRKEIIALHTAFLSNAAPSV